MCQAIKLELQVEWKDMIQVVETTMTMMLIRIKYALLGLKGRCWKYFYFKVMAIINICQSKFHNQVAIPTCLKFNNYLNLIW